MRSLKFKPFLEWFGYSRRERRASFFLVILIITVAAVRLVLPERNMEIEVIPVETFDVSYEATNNNVSAVPDFREVRNTVKATLPLLNLNTSDSAELVSLPGIGPVLAVRIIKYRNLIGGFAYIEQLKEVYGIPEETYLAVYHKVYADSADVKKIRINYASYKQLIRFPYFEKTEVDAIVNFRKQKGRISAMTDIIDNQLIAVEKINKVRVYLAFE